MKCPFRGLVHSGSQPLQLQIAEEWTNKVKSTLVLDPSLLFDAHVLKATNTMRYTTDLYKDYTACLCVLVCVMTVCVYTCLVQVYRISDL